MKSIVVLGAGLAAMPIIRQNMHNIILKEKDWKMVVVAPNTHFHFPIAMVRVIVPGAMSEDKVFIPLEGIFKEFPDKFEFVLGAAEGLDPKGKVVSVSLNNGAKREIGYDALIIATGAAARDDMPWTTMGTTERTLERLHELHRDIARAKTIVVAGGGATGTETAAELAFEYSGDKKKEIYLVHNGDLPLSPGMILGAQMQAKVELERMNVKLVPNSTVTSTVKKTAGVVAVEIKDKNGKTSTVEAGVYIPATGVTPNTSFVPADMLDSKGQIKQSKTLQAESYPDIFVAGDAGSLEASKAQMAGVQAVHIVKSLPGYVLRGEAVPEYTVDTKNTMAVTLGRSKGTGQFGKWKLPSFMVWLLKGRDLFTEGLGAVAAGKKTISTTFEK